MRSMLLIGMSKLTTLYIICYICITKTVTVYSECHTKLTTITIQYKSHLSILASVQGLRGRFWKSADWLVSKSVTDSETTGTRHGVTDSERDDATTGTSRNTMTKNKIKYSETETKRKISWPLKLLCVELRYKYN